MAPASCISTHATAQGRPGRQEVFDEAYSIIMLYREVVRGWERKFRQPWFPLHASNTPWTTHNAAIPAYSNTSSPISSPLLLSALHRKENQQQR